MPRSTKKKRRLPANPDAGKTTLELIEEIVPDAWQWLNTPNAKFGGRAPRELIGGPYEQVLRNLVLGMKDGIFS